MARRWSRVDDIQASLELIDTDHSVQGDLNRITLPVSVSILGMPLRAWAHLRARVLPGSSVGGQCFEKNQAISQINPISKPPRYR